MWDAFKRTLGFTTARQAPAPEPAPSRRGPNYPTDIRTDDSVNFIRRWVADITPARTTDPATMGQPVRPIVDGTLTGRALSPGGESPSYPSVGMAKTNTSPMGYGLQPASAGTDPARPGSSINIRPKSFTGDVEGEE
jgi:hypothetical protein